MAIKGIILLDHVQVNKYVLSVAGLVPITFTAISGIEEELDTVDLPDRTTRSGGRKKQIEFDATQPIHHVIERLAMEAWYRENQDPITPTAQKVGTLTLFSQSRLIMPSYSLLFLYPFKRTLPDLDLDNDGEMGVIVWGMKCSEILPLT